ncbi:MAG: peptidoglycan -binding protein [Actinomycetota bacterium]
MPLARRPRRTLDIWPGFVDALATLLMVIIFVVMVFVLAQYFLGQALSGREAQLAQLGKEMAGLAEQLELEKGANKDLKSNLARLDTELKSSLAERDFLASELSQVKEEVAKAETAHKEALDGERQLTADARAQAELLNQQLAATRAELARISAALEASETKAKEQQVQIADLGKRLNVALAGKVEELQKYRSEFFGKLRQVLGNRPGIRIEGDRFVFQSELLFDSASAELGHDGVEQVRQLAATLKEISAQIPPGVKWILRVDGHTDRRPIARSRFPSNWELSTARAISVVRTLAANGIPPDRLAATGFGEFQPLDPADNEAAWAKNRRIEIRFDQR